ncbi:MAG: hypothetical protein F4X44_04440 [Gammaproteobacteria bacterium]|nr:hypothetical protein [Gammaproteobacteria bacterium]MYD79846.1 hypothetical protein [Gammaproteobacteria bacterium]
MIFDTLKFATRGVKFHYSAQRDSKSLLSELKKLSFLRAVFGKTNRIVGFVYKNNAVLFRMRFPFLHLGKPVLYVSINDDDRNAEVKGSFTFAVYARVLFWLSILFSVTFFSVSSFRLYMAIQEDATALYFIAVIFRMLLGPLVAYITFSWFHWTWKNCYSDMATIAEGLEQASLAKSQPS